MDIPSIRDADCRGLYATITRNSEVLADFTQYCYTHPDERFWQALRNWAGVNFILISELPPYELSEKGNLRDTFYAEGREI